MAFTFRTHGGARAGAGRKPKGARPGVSHLLRPRHNPRHPVHVTWHVRKDIPGLRRRRCYAAFRHALSQGAARFGFRAVHYSVQHNHIHLLVEAQDRRALARGLQGLGIRIAKWLNRAVGRSGRVFADRYHARPLATPTEVKHAIAYVLNNWRRHAAEQGEPLPEQGIDGFSSGPYFDGWKNLRGSPRRFAQGPAVTVEPETWLLGAGWRKAGLLDVAFVPAPPRVGQRARPRRS
jgi:hypothetical protein